MRREILDLWGKAKAAVSAEQMFHPLAFHMLDVAACAEQVIAAWPERFERLAGGIGATRSDLELTAVRLVALHDIGKCARGFQAKVLELWPGALGERPRENSVASVRHDAAGLWLFANSPLRNIAKALLPGCSVGDRTKILQAICGHHGEPVSLGDIREESLIGKAAESIAPELAQAILSVLPAVQPLRVPTAEVARLSFALAGLTTLADWLGSNTTWFTYQAPSLLSGTPDNELKVYWERIARPRAGLAMSEAGLARVEPAPFAGLHSLSPEISRLTPMQSLTEALDLAGIGPALVVIEDMTGAGKTEAALTLAHRFIESGRSRGVYVALPTMATANAMFERLARSYRKIFREDRSPSITLVHAKRDLVEGFALLPRELGANDGDDRQVEADDDPSQISASAFCADWIARSNKQAFLAQVGAGTIDQALLSVLPARHQALRLWGLTDKVLIIDEAHAYDAYMGKEIETLLRFHAELGGSAIVLSATLPHNKRTSLIRAFQQGLGGATPFQSDAAAYPLVTTVSRERVAERCCALRKGLAREVKVLRVENVEAGHAAALDAARRSAAVAVIRNTVDEAIASYATLAREFPETSLFHARFAMNDRLAIEDKVLWKFGRRGERRNGILVATQVIEQSLDLDFDFLVTDLAPIDLLVQRAGRLWRHMDIRPASARPMFAPTIEVISAEPGPQADANWLNGVLPKTKYVYREDTPLLWRTAKVLFEAGRIISKTRSEDESDSPGELRTLIESVYGEERIDIPEALKEAENRAIGKETADRSQARYNVLDFDKGYDLSGGRWESDSRVPTRLAEDTITLRLGVVIEGRLRAWADRSVSSTDARRGWALSEISVRKARCHGVPEPGGEILPLLAAARRDWTVSERDIPVLMLAPDPEDPKIWRGKALDAARRNIDVAYSVETGLSFLR